MDEVREMTKGEREKINSLMHKIEDVLLEENPQIYIGITSLLLLAINHALKSKVTKTTLISFISETYNDNEDQFDDDTDLSDDECTEW